LSVSVSMNQYDQPVACKALPPSRAMTQPVIKAVPSLLSICAREEKRREEKKNPTPYIHACTHATPLSSPILSSTQVGQMCSLSPKDTHRQTHRQTLNRVVLRETERNRLFLSLFFCCSRPHPSNKSWTGRAPHSRLPSFPSFVLSPLPSFLASFLQSTFQAVQERERERREERRIILPPLHAQQKDNHAER